MFAVIFSISNYIQLSFFHLQFLDFSLLHFLSRITFARANYLVKDFSLRQRVIVDMTLVWPMRFSIVPYMIESCP